MEPITIIVIVLLSAAFIFALYLIYKYERTQLDNHNSDEKNPAVESNGTKEAAAVHPVSEVATVKELVFKKPVYPPVSVAFRQHQPLIVAEIKRAFEEMGVMNQVDMATVGTETACFMVFLALRIGSREQTSSPDTDGILEQLRASMGDESLASRFSTYRSVWEGEIEPRCDWGKLFPKSMFVQNDNPVVRVITAFGDFLINPECREDYVFARDFTKNPNYFAFVRFSDYLTNGIFEKICEYSCSFPVQIRYKK